MIDDPNLVLIRQELDRRGWSQRMLADRALIGEATVFRLLKGIYSTKTLRKVEDALEISDANAPQSGTGIQDAAEASLGGYLRYSYLHYEGDFVLCRRGFSDTGKLLYYPFKIAWCDAPVGLEFSDCSPGFEQSGMIYVASGTPFIHFVTLDTGSARMMTVRHMPPGRDFMVGAIMTLAYRDEETTVPAAAPVVIIKTTAAPNRFLAGDGAGFCELSDPDIEPVAKLLRAKPEPIFF